METIETNTTTRMEEDGASDTNDVACQKDVSVNASLNIVDSSTYVPPLVK